MAENGLVLTYTLANYKPHKSACNEQAISNVVERNFDERELLEFMVSDLTFVRVPGKWNYVCLILDLHNREIIGYSVAQRRMQSLYIKHFQGLNMI